MLLSKNILEKYIFFALDNGYKEKFKFNIEDFKIGGYLVFDYLAGAHFIKGDFQEAIIKGLRKNNIYFNKIQTFKDDLNEYTRDQAVALRNQGDFMIFVENLFDCFKITNNK